MKIPQRYLQNRTSNIRQDYATINKSIVDKLNPPNLYRYNPQIEMFARFKTKSSFHKTKRII